MGMKRRQYSKVEKEEIVQKVSSGQSALQLEKENSISPSLINRWKRQYLNGELNGNNNQEIKNKDTNSQIKDDRYLIICVGGIEYSKWRHFLKISKLNNMRLINNLHKKEYYKLLLACDVGLVFLDHRFTIQNFPSRILSYMENSMPVLAATDVNTDIGKVITEKNLVFGVRVWMRMLSKVL